jgi:hypothetical protein
VTGFGRTLVEWMAARRAHSCLRKRRAGSKPALRN